VEHQTAQCVAVKVKTSQGEIVIASMYCLPNSQLTANQCEELLSELGPNFIIAGDWNAHHRLWGSRSSTNRGRALADIILASHMQVLATGGPTHYPYSQSVPSAIDFAIHKGNCADFLTISEILELSSDHFPLIILYRVSACKLSRKTCILPQNANIPQFQEAINGLVNLNMQFKCLCEIFTSLLDHQPAPKDQTAHLIHLMPF